MSWLPGDVPGTFREVFQAVVNSEHSEFHELFYFQPLFFPPVALRLGPTCAKAALLVGTSYQSGNFLPSPYSSQPTMLYKVRLQGAFATEE